ncbi:MutS domain V [Actinacidiphila alni]|uniref:MutS domain V n=1 Tax=Actinacidiphila alni TaxID=380248 RepID=A0A1I2ASJ0_9ACTN|nr:DNA mismatch repair protein MutS [Actinacidiphila alni]SFE46975.1 MutS domain V [Actinacidiphila alni]
MKAFLLHPYEDFDWQAELPSHEPDLTRDLGLETLFDAMDADDAFLNDVARRVVLLGLHDPGVIVYRQEVLRDCLGHPEVLRELYGIAVTAIGGERRIFGSFSRSPDSILYRAVQVLDLFVGQLHELRRTADEHAAEFTSPGFARFFRMLETELDDAYFQTVEDHLTRLKFRGGVQISANLGRGAKGTGYVLREPPSRLGWFDRLTGNAPTSYTYRVPDRDEAGEHDLAELRGRGINLAADALAKSADHILGFFVMLRRELGFYLACLNLHERLTAKDAPVCFPEPFSGTGPRLSCRGLYDTCLALRQDEPVTGNDVDADDRALLVVTGANEGGKSTFLRSVGLAQLMTQAGMFVSAREYVCDVRDAVFTHCRREEDDEMVSGKFDEELARMDDIAQRVTRGGFVLFNESFASTNEREGSEIARQIFRALLESGVKILCVTHLYDLAHSLYEQHHADALFLRAQRRDDGTRTFRLVEGEPEPTSHGEDLYQQVFGTAPVAAGSPRRS